MGDKSSVERANDLIGMGLAVARSWGMPLSCSLFTLVSLTVAVCGPAFLLGTSIDFYGGGRVPEDRAGSPGWCAGSKWRCMNPGT